MSSYYDDSPDYSFDDSSSTPQTPLPQAPTLPPPAPPVSAGIGSLGQPSVGLNLKPFQPQDYLTPEEYKYQQSILSQINRPKGPLSSLASAISDSMAALAYVNPLAPGVSQFGQVQAGIQQIRQQRQQQFEGMVQNAMSLNNIALQRRQEAVQEKLAGQKMALENAQQQFQKDRLLMDPDYQKMMFATDYGKYNLSSPEAQKNIVLWNKMNGKQTLMYDVALTQKAGAPVFVNDAGEIQNRIPMEMAQTAGIIKQAERPDKAASTSDIQLNAYIAPLMAKRGLKFDINKPLSAQDTPVPPDIIQAASDQYDRAQAQSKHIEPTPSATLQQIYIDGKPTMVTFEPKSRKTYYAGTNELVPPEKLGAAQKTETTAQREAAKSSQKAADELNNAIAIRQRMEDDVKNIDDPQAQTDLLFQHMAITTGGVVNMRMSLPVIEQHIKARSLPEETVALFRKWQTGSPITRDQAKRMLNLAYNKENTLRDKYNRVSSGSAGTGTPKIGDKRTYPNGNVGVWDGNGWVLQPQGK